MPTFDQDSLMDIIPHGLKGRVLSLIHKKLLTHLAFFRNKPIEFVSQIIPCMNFMEFDQDEMLYYKGEDASESKLCFYIYIYILHIVYFILTGKVKVMTGDGTQFRYHHKGEYFGELELLQWKVYIRNIICIEKETIFSFLIGTNTIACH